MNRTTGWVCTVTSFRLSTMYETVSSNDTWTAPAEWLIENINSIIDWYGDSIICIKLEPEYEGIQE